jgi:hypothetical protein
MLAYDEKLGFIPGWVECAAGKHGIRIVSGEGAELPAGALYNGAVSARLQSVHDVLVVRFENNQPVEGFRVPFINQTYGDS